MQINIVAAAVLAALCAACGGTKPAAPAPDSSGDGALTKVLSGYVVEFLRRNPTTNTYLGGAGLDPSLKEVDGKLRDHSPAAIAQEDDWLKNVSAALEAIVPTTLSGG